MHSAELITFFKDGGPAMGLILLCSVLALGVAAERAIAAWGVGSQARTLSEQVARSLYRNEVAEARATCERSRSLAADIFLAGFSRHSRGSLEGLQAAVERERISVLMRLKKRLWVLGTVGATAPFIGLFGTVVGIMRAFRDMASAGTGGFAVVAGGISEALITTAAGIIVAVEAVVLYNFFQAHLGRLTVELRLIAEEFIELLGEKPPAPAMAPADTKPA